MDSADAHGSEIPVTPSDESGRSEIDIKLARALRSSWGPDTCAPEDVPDWSDDNPARGQCATTAMVVHDYVGGALMRGEVLVAGSRVDFHWWNRLPDGREVDLTRVQFGAHESVTDGTPIDRPRCPTRMDREYGLLRDRVSNLIGHPSPSSLEVSSGRPGIGLDGGPSRAEASRARGAQVIRRLFTQHVSRQH